MKAELRARNIGQRRALPKDAALAAAKRAAEHAMHVIEHPAGKVVALYSPIKGELKPKPLAAKLRTAGAIIALPRVIDPDMPMHFREWREDDPLNAGFGKIREPSLGAPTVVPDVVIVPLLAFDRRGFRVGYGQGHYDRTLGDLACHERPLTIGFAFAFQEVPEVPRELHDVPLDVVVTEDEIIRCTGPLAGV